VLKDFPTVPETKPPTSRSLTARLLATVSSGLGLLPHSVAWFLVALILFFVTAPFIEELDYGRYIDAGLLSVVLLAAVFAVGGRRQTLMLAIALVVPVILSSWFRHFKEGEWTYRVFVAFFILFIAFVVHQFFRFVLRSPRVNSEVLCAAVSIYLLMALLWGSAYTMVARLNPGAFSGVPAANEPLHGFAALYFSMITLTTVGYGDIAPVSGPARMLAMLEAVSGTMYLAVLIARLVAIHTTNSASNEPNK